MQLENTRRAFPEISEYFYAELCFSTQKLQNARYLYFRAKSCPGDRFCRLAVTTMEDMWLICRNETDTLDESTSANESVPLKPNIKVRPSVSGLLAL